jgi:hypothetical protein
MIHNSDNIANRTGRTGDSPHCENRAEAGRSSKLYSVDLATNATLDVTFNYGGDQKRRSMTAGGVTTGYNWDAGWNVINEENGSGTLARTYFHHPQLLTRATLAHVNGANPATGAYNYYIHDHLGSTRALYNQSKALLVRHEEIRDEHNGRPDRSLEGIWESQCGLAPPLSSTTPGACSYGLCFESGIYHWDRDCICKCMSDGPRNNCMRGCLQCLHDHGWDVRDVFHEDRAHQWCQRKCKWDNARMTELLLCIAHCRKPGMCDDDELRCS